MWLFHQASTAARTALIYITTGALIVIWTVVWYVYLFNHSPETSASYYWCTGFLVTGLTLIVIGLALGSIGRSARRAELPPDGTPLAVMNPQSQTDVTTTKETIANSNGSAIVGTDVRQVQL
jgi:hypothetical protein